MALLVGLTVLFLEDDTDAGEAMKAGLERHGARVLTSASAQVALLLWEQHSPDAVVADLDLADPEIDAWMFMRAARELLVEQKKRTPAIALSAHNEPADKLKSLSAGFTLHMSKPITPDQLAARIGLLTRNFGSVE